MVPPSERLKGGGGGLGREKKIPNTDSRASSPHSVSLHRGRSPPRSIITSPIQETRRTAGNRRDFRHEGPHARTSTCKLVFNCCRRPFVGGSALSESPGKAESNSCDFDAHIFRVTAGGSGVLSVCVKPRRRLMTAHLESRIKPLYSLDDNKTNHFNPHPLDSSQRFSHYSHVSFERELKENSFCYLLRSVSSRCHICFLYFGNPNGFMSEMARQMLKYMRDWSDRSGHPWACDSDIRLVPVNQFQLLNVHQLHKHRWVQKIDICFDSH